MRKTIATLAAAAVLSTGLVIATPTPALAFTGHGCRKSTCRFFTSSHYSAVYFYDRSTCDQWKGLSDTYLHGFRTKRALKNNFDRRLHAAC